MIRFSRIFPMPICRQHPKRCCALRSGRARLLDAQTLHWWSFVTACWSTRWSGNQAMIRFLKLQRVCLTKSRRTLHRPFAASPLSVMIVLVAWATSLPSARTMSQA